jgi:hypothetical protein
MYAKLKTGAAYTLEESLHFDYDDLTENARGVLSERQQETLNQKRKQWLLIFSGLSIFFGVLAIQAVGQWMTFAYKYDVYCIYIAVGAVGLFLIYMAYAKWNGYTQALQLPLETVEGMVELDVVTGNKSLRYSLAVGDVQFYVEKPIFLAFKNGDPYRIYYAPAAKIIVSAEWLRGSKF